ncbi:MAG: PEGA domain-containing protein, partial [Gemmatimonadetes bacterium]|nr:PEGA domain-containing protein [Gemmatimonadota bacterium]
RAGGEGDSPSRTSRRRAERERVRPTPTSPTRAASDSAAPSPAAPTRARRAEPGTASATGRLFVNATPWGQLFIDGQPVGNTPRANLEIPAGTHHIRVVRDGFEPFDRTIEVAAGQEVRLTGIVLVEHRP